MASRKRLLEKFNDLGSAGKPTKPAKIHGVVTSLSSMKAGKYFDGRISDDTKSMRLVGFDTVQQRELAAQHDQNQPVALHNCIIQKFRYSDNMEVLITKSTTVATSPRKFKNTVASKTAANSITLDQLQTLQNYKHVTVLIKVLRADAKIEVKPGLCKQELCISDATGTARLTV